jgi:ATP-binding cassette subfamily B protein
VFETERVDNMADTLLSGSLPALITATVLIAILFWLNAVLVAIAAVFLPLIWLVGRLTGGRLSADVKRFQLAFEDFGRGIRFVLDHLPLTRARAAEAWEIARQDATIERLRDAAVRMADASARHFHAQTNLVGLPGIVLLVAGGISVAQGAMTLGSFLAFYVAAGQLNGRIEGLANAVPAIISGNTSLAVLWRLRQQGPPQPYAGTRVVDWRGEIALRDVTFAYSDRSILRNVSLVLQPGSTVAIVGPNGAGKTTLINLILGFYRPQSGQLEADGTLYETIDLPALRRQIGLVPQHPVLFAGTVFDNIAYGRPDATRNDALTAVRRAAAASLLAELPEGLDTPIGEDGALLSGGQRQLLALARALLGPPRLLILDEPTNHLDQATIRRLMETIVASPDQPAVLLVSHDPAVIAFADRVWQLDDGTLHAAEPAIGLA